MDEQISENHLIDTGFGLMNLNYFSDDVEDYMFNNGILTREEFKQQVWTDGFLSGKNDIRQVF